jgi:hypothetical protein
MTYKISQDLIKELEEQVNDTESVADRIIDTIYSLPDDSHDCKLESDGHCPCMEGRQDGEHDCETDNSAGNVDADGTCLCCGKTDLI